MKTTVASVAILSLVLSLGLPFSGRAQWRPDGAPIAALAGYQGDSHIAPDGHGGAYIVWRDDGIPGNMSDIYIQRVDQRGYPLWADGGIAIASGPTQQHQPYLCLDSSDYAIVVYQNGTDIYAQSVSSYGGLVWGASGVPVATDVVSPTNLRVVAGSSGRAIIGWIDRRNGNPDIYAQQLNFAGVIQWASSGVVICNAANDQGEMEMIADGSGGAIFAWEDNRTVAVLPIYAQKISSGGVVQWTANGLRLSTADTWQYVPEVVSDGAGGAIVAWYDMRNGTDDNIYTQRVLSAGSRAWVSGGLAVCAATGEQTWPVLAPDGAGGAIYAWTDARTSAYTDIYAQRFSSSGIAQWTTNGVSVSDTSGGQSGPVIVSDGVGGAIIAWQDRRLSNSYDIFAQRIDGAGAPQWLMDGELVCDALMNQSLIHIVSDGTQGAIIAWDDERTAANGKDVYAERMEKHGYWGYPCPLNLAGVDVPHDQGGSVLLTWDASYLDAFPEEIVTRYVIWRSIDGASYAPLDSIDAYYLGSYQYAAATTVDSNEVTDYVHWFKVRAMTLSPDAWWDSKAAPCYSVDNLAPAEPEDFVAEQSSNPAGLELAWTPNGEPDLDHYAVYRGVSESFLPGDENRIGSPREASFFDAEWRWNSGYVYKVSAIDANGNESAYAAVAPENVTGGGGAEAPRATYLSQNFPNPFNPATRIRFGLREPAYVSLRVYDATGRLVRVLAEGSRSEGNHAELWDGTDDGGAAMASGIYFYRLEAGTFSRTRKMVLLK